MRPLTESGCRSVNNVAAIGRNVRVAGSNYISVFYYVYAGI